MPGSCTARDGLDEITTTGPTRVTELKDGKIRSFEVRPEDAGLPPASLEDLKGGDATVNAAAIRELLGGEPGPSATSWCSTRPRR